MKRSPLYKLHLVICAAILTIALASCEKEPEPERYGSLQLSFENMVNNQPLELNTTTYTNANGDDFTVSMFKYYISNIRLKKADGTEYVQPESYYLLDHTDPASKTIQIGNVPAGEYTGLSFILGIDSTRNVSGAQTGALDPLHGMFWTWNSGYIFLKMEGTSPQSGVRQTAQYYISCSGHPCPESSLLRTSSSACVADNVKRGHGCPLQNTFRHGCLKEQIKFLCTLSYTPPIRRW